MLIGLNQMYGNGLPKNPSKVIEYFQEDAKNVLATGLRLIGSIHYKVNGVEQIYCFFEKR